MIGSSLSHFKITAKLGEGGMGEVYRAEDTKLGRDVAIKVLPEAVANDPERLARFEREAKVLASLNHPNIAGIHQVEETDGVTFLVMELVEGEDLKERLERGAMAVAEAVAVAGQIAEALEAAHDKGVVHRDLKPANVKVTPDGQVKVLDFGLAKALDPEAERATDLSMSPTLTAQMTGAGVLLGTAAYMSPEQARGKEVDKRTDIWAFGCVLYEMLSAQSPFNGDTVSDVLARILERDVDFETLPPSTPSGVRRLLEHCLEKDANRRLRDIGDAHWDLTENADLEAFRVDSLPPSRRLSAGALALSFVAGLALGGLVLWLGFAGKELEVVPSTQEVGRFVIDIPPSEAYSILQNSAIALSPDGQMLAYAADSDNPSAISQMYLRHLDRFYPEPIPDTENAYAPFFSPDGEWLGFFQDSTLWKKPIRGGPAIRLGPSAGFSRGASWTNSDQIFYSPTWFSPIFRVAADGGERAQVTTLADDEKSHRFPSALPDGSAVIFTVGRSDTASFDDASIDMQSTVTGERRTLIEGGSFGKFLPPDRLMYGRAGQLFVAPLDVGRLEITGAPVPVLDDLITSPTFGSAQLALGDNGSLAYLAGSPDLFNARLTEVSETGETIDIPLEKRPFSMARYSPDGKQLALRIDGANGQLWVYDLERGTLSKITREWDADFPSWAPDGQSLVYSLSKGGSSDVAQIRTDGTGEPITLYTGINPNLPQIAPDGQTLVFSDVDPETGRDIWVLRLDGKSERIAYLRTPAEESDAIISPDGKWLAYATNESGRAEVYVQAYPEPRRRWQISAQGGRNPAWDSARQELLFKNGTDLMAVPFTSGTEFQAGIPRLRFKLEDVTGGRETRAFDISTDGRFITAARLHDWQPTGRLHLILNWTSTLE